MLLVIEAAIIVVGLNFPVLCITCIRVILFYVGSECNTHGHYKVVVIIIPYLNFYSLYSTSPPPT